MKKQPKFQKGQEILVGNQKFVIVDVEYSIYKSRYIYTCKRNDVTYYFKEGEIKLCQK